MCKEHYQELLSMLLYQLLILIHRKRNSEKKIRDGFVTKEMEDAIFYFSEYYQKEISIEAYAISHHMSVSWFIQNFKKYTGFTPMQYVLSLRITNAENLLETTEYNIAEISNIVGYENPLYFSRIFKKQKGLSPSEYRKRIKN